MLEHTKKPPTEDMAHICIRVPADKAEDTMNFLRAQGYTIAEDQEPNATPEEVLGEITIGRLLRGARHREGLTQQALADAIGGKKHHISEMEHNKRTIGKKLAKRLSQVLDVDYRMFL